MLLAGTVAVLGGSMRARATAATIAAGSPVGHREFPLQTVVPGANRSRRLLFWYPAAAPDDRQDAGAAGRTMRDAQVASGRHPVVLFSHGFLGAADQSTFISESLARIGYVVVAPDHDDAAGRSERVELPDFLRPQDWNDLTQAGRRRDLTATLDHLATLDAAPAAFLQGRLDLQRIGALGHSLGGYAVLGLAGARAKWHDPRIRAVAGLSPFITPYLQPTGFAAIRVPVLLQGGEFDIGITPTLTGFYSRLGAPKYLLVLRGAHHLAWTDFAARGRDTTAPVRSGNPHWIIAYTAAFFDQYLRGLDRSTLLAAGNGALGSFAFDPGTGDRR
jgi:predicted dienelactone hydrolase